MMDGGMAGGTDRWLLDGDGWGEEKERPVSKAGGAMDERKRRIVSRSRL